MGRKVRDNVIADVAVLLALERLTLPECRLATAPRTGLL
jgi:hypothetical protein